MSADDSEERRQLADIQNQIQRARRASVRTSAVESQRKEILKHLIELVHSPYSSLKSFAANNIKLFIKEFPDLEDDAINAVYDLCEDQDPRVRKDGYRAITQVSREQKKWVKRNADVLVQLLQSDEPEEVEVVEQQLTEHLDMDPNVTLGVLCDQIVPPEEPMDEEDQAIRDRLRSLVLGFMVGRAKRAIVERHAQPAEAVLVDGLVKTMSRLRPMDIDIIVKDILLSLPSFGRYSQRGNDLLESILTEAKTSHKSELSTDGGLSPLTKTRYYLSLAAYVAIERHVARPTSLLRFYCQTFASRITLLRLNADLRAFMIDNFAKALSSLQENAPKMVNLSAEEVTQLCNTVVDVSPALFSCFVELENTVLRPWQACRTLLQACVKRKTSSSWTPPAQLTPILEQLQVQASAQIEVQEEDKHVMQEIINLTRSLLGQPKPQSKPPPKVVPAPLPASTSSTNNVAVKGMTANNSKPNGGAVHIKRQRDDSSASQRSISAVGSGQTQTTAIHQHPAGRQWPQKELTEDVRNRNQIVSAPGSSTRATPSAEHEPLSKRKKGAGGEAAVPSLLSRMLIPSGDGRLPLSQPPSSVPAKRRADSESTQAKRPNTQQRRSGEPELPPGGYNIKGADSAKRPNPQHNRTGEPDVPAGGWSIKGAARRQSPPKDNTSSLLDRLNPSSEDAGGRGRRRRTKI